MVWKTTMNKRRKQEKKCAAACEGKGKTIFPHGAAKDCETLLWLEMNYRLLMEAEPGEPLLWVEEVRLSDFTPGKERAQRKEKARDKRVCRNKRKWKNNKKGR